MRDPVIGLPSPALFADRLRHALARAARRPDALAVLVIDLGRVGAPPAASDAALLPAIGRRLQGTLRTADTLTHLGGDRFACLLEDVTGVQDVALVAERIADRLAGPGSPAPVVGIALGEGHEAGGELLRQAIVAQAAAHRDRALAPVAFAVYDPTLTAPPGDRVALAAALRRAIATGELDVHYQSIVHLATGRVAGFAARLHGQPARGGTLPAGDVLARAEAVGLSVPLGRWLLLAACRQARAWHDATPIAPPRFVAVTLAGEQLRDPGLADDVARALRESALPPARLRLELPQALVLADVVAAAGQVLALRAVGVQVAITGFGTGYAALGASRLGRLDGLTIAAVHVQGLGINPDATAIVRAGITIGRALGVPVAAAGIRTATQAAALRRLGCTFGFREEV